MQEHESSITYLADRPDRLETLAEWHHAEWGAMHPGHTLRKRIARMQEHLGLSDEQMRQMREIRENGGSREEIFAVLNDEQRALMDERRGQMKGHGGQDGHHGHGHPHGQGRPSGSDQQPDQADQSDED